MNKIIIEDKLNSLAELLQKLECIIKEYSVNTKLQEFLLYAAEKKAEEIVELSISINQELLKDKDKLGLSYYESFTNLSVFKIY